MGLDSSNFKNDEDSSRQTMIDSDMVKFCSNCYICYSFQADTVGELPSDIGAAGFLTSPFQKYRGSIAWTEGFEKNLHVLAKDQYPDRAMGIFTSGGDAQGKMKIS